MVAILLGASVWLPVGMLYFSFFMYAIAILASGQIRQRFGYLKSQPVAWIAWAFWCWVLLAWAINPGGEHAQGMLFHTSRTALVVTAALLLSRQEARFALASFCVTAVLMIFALWLDNAGVPVPRAPGLDYVLDYSSNKSIRACLMTAGLAGSALAFSIAAETIPRIRIALAAVTVFAGAAVVFLMHSRLAMILIPLLVAMVGLHRVRNPKGILIAIVAVVVLASSAYWLSERFRQRLGDGWDGLRQGMTQATPHDMRSWSLRYHFYAHSVRVVKDNPIVGIGPGNWSESWSRWRGLQSTQNTNPHSDVFFYASESGLPAMGLLLFLFAIPLWKGWRRRGPGGAAAMVAASVALAGVLVNSGTRDAVFGLTLPWLMLAAMRAFVDDA